MKEGLRYRFGIIKVVVGDLQGCFHGIEIEETVSVEQLVPIVTSKVREKLGAHPEDARLLCNWDVHGPFDFIGQPKLRYNGIIAMRLIPEPKLEKQGQQGTYLPLHPRSIQKLP